MFLSSFVTGEQSAKKRDHMILVTCHVGGLNSHVEQSPESTGESIDTGVFSESEGEMVKLGNYLLECVGGGAGWDVISN